MPVPPTEQEHGRRGFHEKSPAALSSQARLGGRSHPTYHDDRDPSGGAVLLGERVVKVLLEFTCDLGLHVVFLGGIVLERSRQ